MKRRCWFLDNLPAYNYNTGAGIKMKNGDITDTKHLGSTLVAAMMKEAEQFCRPCLSMDGDHQFCQPFLDKGSDYHQVYTSGLVM